MKDQILKIAKVKSEKEFYKKYPTEEAFMAKHGKQLKKAAMGAAMVKKQLTQLTDFSNPPQAQDGIHFADALSNAQQNLAKSTQAPEPEKESTLTSILNVGKQLGGMLSEASSEEMRRGGYLPIAQGGGIFNVANAIGGAFTTPGKAATGTTPATPASGGLGDTLGNIFGGAGGAKGIAQGGQDIFKGGFKSGMSQLGTKAGLGAAGKAAGMGLLNAAPQILEGIGQMQEQKKAIKKADQMSQISGLTAQAAESRDISKPKNQYVRPEDQMIQGLNPQGGGTNFLAAYGASIGGNPTEIQNTYNPGDLYSDLGYEPLNDSNVKQFQKGGKVKFDPSTYKSSPMAQSSDVKNVSNTFNADDFSNYSTIINKYPNMSNDTSYMYAHNTPTGTEEFFHNTNRGNPISQLRRGKEFINLSPEQVNSYKQKVLTGTGGFEHGGHLHTAEFGEYFQNSGQASIGKGAGSAIGSAFFGPIGGQVGGFLGGVAGNLLGGAKDARQLKGFEDKTKANTERAAVQSTAQGIQDTYSSYMEDGGWVSNEWQPQTITKFGEYNVKDLLAPPHDADMLRAGGTIGSGYYTPPSARALQTYEYGGQMAMGGDLEVHRGKAEPISYNPFLPEGGETVMFKGPSHDNGGMPISYGQNGVEVEGGEPAVKLADGGSPDGNLVVFGNMKIDDMAANHIGVEASKGKKYKSFINNLSKFEARQNSIVEKGSNLVNSSNTNDPFDQLAMNSGRLMIMGGNAKLLNAAIIKERAAGVQNAILDTAKEYGVKSDELAKGKFIKDKNSDMAKFGAKMKKAQSGDKLDPATLEGIRRGIMPAAGMPGSTTDNQLVDVVVNSNRLKYPPANIIPFERSGVPLYNMAPQLFTGQMPNIQMNKNKVRNKFDWEGLAQGITSNLAPLFRPSNQQGLDPNQIYPEMFALASNQLDPVNAQQYNPRLKQAYDISLQDQLNEVDAQVRAATKMIGSNPAAAAQIFATASDAKNKIRGEQFRMNQANKVGIQNANIDTMNQAQMQNLQLLDQQYSRQAQAKSNTKAQTFEALKSIAAKTAQNKLENRQLGIMENMYNYRFGPNGQAYNINNPYQFNPQGSPFARTNSGSGQLAEGYEDIYNSAQQRIGTRKKGKDSSTDKNGGKIKARNGSIVKALKTL
jgi:hypothetical protein